jgi:hypothetical protein
MNTLLVVIPPSILYFLWIAWLDRYFRSFEIAKVISYTLTTTICIVNELTSHPYIDFAAVTLFGLYTYEIIYYRPDRNHMIHHIISYVCISYSLYAYSCRFPYTLTENEDCAKYVVGHRLNNILTIVNVSSIFSALRNIYPNEFVRYLYYIVYLISKIGAMIVYFHYAYRHYDDVYEEKYYVGVVAILFMLQMYFCWTIVKIMMKKRTKQQ